MSAETAAPQRLDSDTDEKSEHPVAWWRPTRSWLYAVSAAVIAAVVFGFARYTLIDDAYITLDYARNVAFHLHWGLIGAATSNTATSALNVLALALFTAITRNAVVALGILFVLSTIGLEVGLRVAARRLGLPAWLGLLAVALVSVNPLLISSIGLEVALGAGLIGLLVAAAVTERPVWFGVLAGLLLLTRPDLLIVVLVVFLVRPAWYRGWWKSLLAGAAVTLPWYLWSWLMLGSAVPATLIIKTNQRSWGRYQFGNGPALYHDIYPTATILSFLPLVLGVLAALIWLALRILRPTDRLRRLDRFAALPVAGVLHYLAYSALGVPPYHWYYGPSIVCLTAFLAAAVAAMWPESASVAVARRLPGFAVAALAVVLLAVSIGDYTSGGVPRVRAQITTNWASPAQYQVIGTGLAKIAGNRTVGSFGEIGAVAYFCDCSMIDEFSDPGAVAGMVNTSVGGAHSVKRLALRANFHFLDRTQRPVVPQLQLTYTTSPVPGALASWPAYSPWTGGSTHYVSVIPNPNH